MKGKSLSERLPATRRGLFRTARAGAAMLAAAAVVAACEIVPPSQESASLSFADLPPLVFDLGGIEIVEPAAARHPSDVDHLLPNPPAVAARLWADDRLQTSGHAGLLRVRIEEASARLTPLAINTDLEGLFTKEQAEQLDVRLRVTIEAVDGSGAVRGHATADARRSRTLPEGISLNERERLYDQVVAALLQDFNASQEQAIRQYLHIYLR